MALALGTARHARRRRCYHVVSRAAREAQVLRFIEPTSGSEVVLVACIHFHPASVAKVSRLTAVLEEQGALAAVVLEQCPTRWGRLTRSQPRGTPLRNLLDNEMQAAAELAEAAGLPVVLGDQTVEELTENIRDVAMTSALDLRTVDGVKRSVDIVFRQCVVIAGMIPRSNHVSPGQQEDCIGFRDFLEPGLLLGIPVAVCRYILRAPKLSFSAFTILALTANLPDNPPESDDLIFAVISVGLQLLVALGMLRTLFTVFLQDRDSVLADSIRETCMTSSGPGRSVVAVLGATHCNGVKRSLLQMEQ